MAQELAKYNIKQAFETHFEKINQLPKTAGPRVLKRSDTLTSQKFDNLRLNARKNQQDMRDGKKLTKTEKEEFMRAQDHIYGVVEPSGRIRKLPFQNFEAIRRRVAVPHFKMEREIEDTQVK